MKTVLLFLGLLLAGSSALLSQTSYSWATYPTRCTGVGVYTQPNMTVDVTGTGYANYGPQCAASACAATSGNRYFSPKYVTSPNASAPDWQANGLALGMNWPNTTSNANVLITFTTPVCGPLTFTVYDINSGTCCGSNPIWRDRVTFTGTNDLGGGITPSSISACGGNAVAGNVISATIAGTGCTNSTHTITYNAPLIKTINILYTSMNIDPTWGTDPDPQYIIISDLTSTVCVLPSAENVQALCTDDHAGLTWEGSDAAHTHHYNILRSTNAQNAELAGTVPAISNTGTRKQPYLWTDPQPLRQQTYYQLVAVDQDGGESASEWIADRCFDQTEMSVSPNPAADAFTVTFTLPSGSSQFTISLFDISGKQVMEQSESLSADDADHVVSRKLDVSGLAPGVYALKCSAGGKVFMERVVVERP